MLLASHSIVGSWHTAWHKVEGQGLAGYGKMNLMKDVSLRVIHREKIMKALDKRYFIYMTLNGSTFISWDRL